MTYGLNSFHTGLLTSAHIVNLNSSVQLFRPKHRPGVKSWANVLCTEHTRMNLSPFPHNVPICFPKLYLIPLQICGAGSVFSECWFPHLCDHSAGPLSLHLSAQRSHASFWAKYIFREILRSKSYALFSQGTQKALLTAFFFYYLYRPGAEKLSFVFC